MFNDARGNAEALRQHDTRKLNGSAGACIGSERTDLAPGNARNQKDAAYRSKAGYADGRNDREVLAGDFGYGHKPDIDMPGFYLPGTFRRDRKAEMDLPPLFTVTHSPHKRDGIQIANCTDADAGWILFQSPILDAAAIAPEVDVQPGAKTVPSLLADLSEPEAAFTEGVTIHTFRHQDDVAVSDANR